LFARHFGLPTPTGDLFEALNDEDQHQMADVGQQEAPGELEVGAAQHEASEELEAGGTQQEASEEPELPSSEEAEDGGDQAHVTFMLVQF
jgi:hypothetical protein